MAEPCFYGAFIGGKAIKVLCVREELKMELNVVHKSLRIQKLLSGYEFLLGKDSLGEFHGKGWQ